MTWNLWQHFSSTAQRRGGGPALVCDDVTVAFDALAAEAEAVAAGLYAMGVRRGDVVGLHLPKGTAVYTLLLACLRLGAPYVTMDTRAPDGRTEKVIARVRPRLLASEQAIDNPFGAVVAVRGAASLPRGDVSTLPPVGAVLETDPAYIMFTSGSTGEPKGAVIPHIGIKHLMIWGRDLLGEDARRCAGLNPLHFDNSVFDIYCGLVNGSTLCPIETAGAVNPMQWIRSIRARKPEVLFAVPTLFVILDQLGMLTPESLPDARMFIFGGEGFPIDTLRAFNDRFVGKARLINVYGPTETSCICSSIEVGPDAFKEGARFASLGRMHSGFRHAVLDSEGMAVERGVAGELWIGGPCVALGYYNNPEETQRRFIQNPAHADYRDIWYRTGDMVAEDAAGRLWFQGRADNQVKIRGHRIELEEIDLVLERIEGVSRAVAVAVDGPDGAELRAMFVAARTVPDDELKAAFRTLPNYMWPGEVRQVDSLPLNANGKVDRRAVKVIWARV